METELNNSNLAIQGDDVDRNDVLMVDPNLNLTDKNSLLHEGKGNLLIENENWETVLQQHKEVNIKTEYSGNKPWIRKSNSEENIETNMKKKAGTGTHISSGPNHNDSTYSELDYIKENLINLFENVTITRCFNSRITKDSKKIIESCFKRFVLMNLSDKEFKVRINFVCSDSDEFVNTYMPYSEIVVYTKKNSVTPIYIFSKEDIRLPWNEINHEIDIENPEPKSVRVEESQQTTIKKSHSYDNLNHPNDKGI